MGRVLGMGRIAAIALMVFPAGESLADAASPASAARSSSANAHARYESAAANSEPRPAPGAQQHRAILASQYPGAGDALGMSPEEVDRFFEAWAEFRRREMPWSDGSRETRPPTREELAQRLTSARDFQEREMRWIRSLLGEPRYARWQEYQRTVPARRALASAREALAGRGVPLEARQEAALLPILNERHLKMNAVIEAEKAKVIANSRPRTAEEKLDQLDENLRAWAEINAWVEREVAGILTEEQRRLYAEHLDRPLRGSRMALEAQRRQLASRVSGS